MGKPLLLAQTRAPLRALGGLQILRLRLRGGTAAWRQPPHFELRDNSLRRQTEPVPDADTMRRLDPLGIQMNLSTRDRRGRQTSRFVKAAVPQPFIQPMTLRIVAAAVAVFAKVITIIVGNQRQSWLPCACANVRTL